MTHEEEMMLRELAAKPHYIKKVSEVFGTLSLWSESGLEEHIDKKMNKELETLEQELLKLKSGVASNSDYIQGRWDLIGEFQDIIRARRKS